MDPPHHINWHHGFIGVNNEAAEQGGLSHILWRYNNPNNPCDPKNEPPPFLANILNFGVLAFLLYRFGRKPLAEALAKRKQAIMSEIDKATELNQQAEARLKEYQNKLKRLEETLAALKAEHVAQAEIERKNLLIELEERRARMRRDAEFRVEQELKAARVELLQEALADEYLRSIPVALGSSTLAGRAEGTQSTGANP
jgi:F-type H+-transporting ATPase subunit b